MWRLFALLMIFARSVPTVASGAIASAYESSTSRHYRYDGVRRIQEVVTRQEAVVIIPPGGAGGEGGTGVPPVSGVGGIEPPLEAQPLDPIAPGATLVVALPAGWDQREYVWGPEYVDELAWQIAGDGTTGPGIAYYSLLDANYNVMVLAAGGPIPPPSGAAAGTPTLPAGTVVEQYVWSPYGELLSRDVLDLRIDTANGGTPSATYGQLLTDAGAARPPNGNDPGSPGTARRRPDQLYADCAYDSHPHRMLLWLRGIEPVIARAAPRMAAAWAGFAGSWSGPSAGSIASDGCASAMNEATASTKRS